jgi:signal transduction histidine kinase
MEDIDNVEVEEDDPLFQFQQVHDQNESAWIENYRELLGIIGHELNSPIGTIIGFLNLLKDGIHELDRSEIQSHIDIVLLASQSTKNLLDNLLNWALAGNIGKSFKPEVFNFCKVLDEEIENLKLFLVTKKISIHLPKQSYSFVVADKEMVKIILRNLLNNATKYSHKFGKIVITIEPKKHYLEIAIKDEGIGINKDVIAKILNSTNHDTTLGTLNEPGNGFGLLLCKKIIDIHKCNIYIVSKPNMGTVFKFTLPLHTKVV